MLSPSFWEGGLDRSESGDRRGGAWWRVPSSVERVVMEGVEPGGGSSVERVVTEGAEPGGGEGGDGRGGA